MDISTHFYVTVHSKTNVLELRGTNMVFGGVSA